MNGHVLSTGYCFTVYHDHNIMICCSRVEQRVILLNELLLVMSSPYVFTLLL